MGLFDLLTRRNLATDVRFKFVGLQTGVLQRFLVPKTDDLVIASNVIYIAKFFRVGQANQRALMQQYLRAVASEAVTFQKDPGADVYSHEQVWALISGTLTPLEQKAAVHAFYRTGTGAPVYYTLGGVGDGKHYGEYVLRLVITRGVPSDYMKISYRFSKLLLPLSVSVFFNHNLNQVNDPKNKKRLLRVTLAFLEQLASQGFPETPRASGLLGFFKEQGVAL
jgi:hypothetical protein